MGVLEGLTYMEFNKMILWPAKVVVYKKSWAN